jgi:hypothetical protein
MPQRSVPAKRKINNLQERIEKISKYHGFDSIWFEKRTVKIDLPEIRRELKVDFVVNRKTVVDSVLFEYSEGKIDKQTFIERILMEEISFEDDSLKVNIKIYPQFFELDYTIKARKDSIQIEVERITVDSGLKYYQQTGYWITVIIFMSVISGIFYLFFRK